jgi:hypothetical protein
VQPHQQENFALHKTSEMMHRIEQVIDNEKTGTAREQKTLMQQIEHEME